MSNPPQDVPVNAGLTLDALQEWTRHVEAVLRGLGHSMNNRAAALSAAIELSSDPGDDGTDTREILGAEMPKLQELVRVIRAIGAARGGVEAFTPSELTADISAIAALHAELRDYGITIDADSAPPVRLNRASLLRAVVAFIGTRRPAEGERNIAVTLRGDGDWLVVRSDSRGEPSAYAEAMARAMGGGALDGGAGFRVPTLETIRLREGR